MICSFAMKGSCHYSGATQCISVTRNDCYHQKLFIEIGKYSGGYYASVSPYDLSSKNAKWKTISSGESVKKFGTFNYNAVNMYDNSNNISGTYYLSVKLNDERLISDDFFNAGDSKAPVFATQVKGDTTEDYCQMYIYSSDATVDNGTLDYTTGDKSSTTPSDGVSVPDTDDYDNSADNFNAQKTCKSLLGDSADSSYPAYWIQKALSLIRYAAIIVLLVLSSYDFIKAIISQDGDALKKATGHLYKRLLYCVIIFFVPTIVKFVLTTLGIEGSCTIVS